MKKLLLIGSMMLLCSGNLSQAMIDFDKAFGGGSDFDFGDAIGGQTGSADDLVFQLYFDNSQGEQPGLLKEYQGSIRGVNAGTWYWDDPAKQVHTISRSLVHSEMNAKQLKEYENKKMNNVYRKYAPKDDGGAQLYADMKALDDRASATHNVDLKAKLEYLLELAKRVYNYLQSQQIKNKTTQEFDNFTPSKLGSGYVLSTHLENAQVKHAEAKKSRDTVLMATYNNIIKHLENIDAEAEKFKKMSDDDLEKAIEKAKHASRLAGSEDKKSLYIEVVALLQQELEVENTGAGTEDEYRRKAEDAVKELLLTHSLAANALEHAQEHLDELRKELQSLQKRRMPKNKIKEQEQSINIQEKIIKDLKEKAKNSEIEEKAVAKKIEDLLAKHDDNAIEAFREALHNAYASILVKNKKFAGLKDEFESKKTARAKVKNIDFKVAEKLELLANEANEKLNTEELIQTTAKTEVEKHADPEASLESEISALNILKDTRREDVAGGAQVTSKPIQEQDLAIKNKEAVIKGLQLQKKEFDQSVDRLYKKALQVKNGNKKDALEWLLPSAGYGSRLYGAVWDAKAVLQNRIEKILTEPVSSEFTLHADKGNDDRKRHVQHKAAIRLRDDLRQAQAQAVKEDPVAKAQARLAAAGPFEVSGATTELAEAVIFKASKGKMSIQNLPVDTQNELKSMLLEGSQKIKAVAESPRLSELKKAEEKQIITRGLMDNIFTLCAPAFLGSSRGGLEAAAKGDATTFLFDRLATGMINGMQPQAQQQAVDVY